MKSYYFILLSILFLPFIAHSQLKPNSKLLNTEGPGEHLKNIVFDEQIKEIMLIRPLGKNTDTTRYKIELEKFIFGQRLLIIDTEKIFLDSVTHILINHQNGKKNLVLHSKDVARHYDQNLKNNPELLSILENRKDEKEMLGQVAPDFTATTLSGKTIKLSELRGKVILLNFWFLGCLSCRKEIPDLNKLAEEYPDIEIISIALNNKEELLEHIEIESEKHYKLSKFYAYFGDAIHYEIIPDGNEIIEKYNFTGYPINFFIDREGVIQRVSRFFEPRSYNYRKLVENVTMLVNK